MRIGCTVIDISSVGACLRLEEPLPDVDMLRLIIANVPPIAAVPTWCKKGLVGIVFQDEQAWVLDSYSKRFDPAAWLED